MRRIAAYLAALVALVGPAAPTAALAQPRAATSAASHLVVFNRTGPNWARREAATAILLAHREIYRRLAETGEILFSGRFDGEPALGMAVFGQAIDEARIRQLLENDPAVAGGYVALEFRRFAVAFGSLRGANGR